MQVTETEIDVGGDASIGALIASPQAKRGPAVVVIPSIFGLDFSARARAEALARSGFLAVVIDPFSGLEPAGPVTNVKVALERSSVVDPAAVESALAATCAFVRRHERSDRRVTAIGVGFGGRFAVHAAAAGWVDGAAAWHGGGLDTMQQVLASVLCPLELDFGQVDASIPLDRVAVVQTAVAGIDNIRVRVHPDAAHGFTLIGQPSYLGAADRLAMSSFVRMARAVPSKIPGT